MDLLTPRQRREFEAYLKAVAAESKVQLAKSEAKRRKLLGFIAALAVLLMMPVFFIKYLPESFVPAAVILAALGFVLFFLPHVLLFLVRGDVQKWIQGTGEEYGLFCKGSYSVGQTTLDARSFAHSKNGIKYLRDTRGMEHICPFEEDFRLAYAGEKMVTVTIGETRYILRGKTLAGPDAPQPPLSLMMNAAAQPVPVPMGAPYGMPEPVPVPMPAAPDFALNTMAEDDSQEPF